MDGTSGHFSKTIAVEAMRLLDEENLSLTQAYQLAAERMAKVPGYEPPHALDHLPVAEPGETD